LIDELKNAETLRTYREYLAQLTVYELLAIDDFGLIQFDSNECKNLFEVLESKNPHKSTVIISQLSAKS